MRRSSNAAASGGGGGRLSKLKKRRRHTGSPTPSSLSAPASGVRRQPSATQQQPPRSSSGALTQQVADAGGAGFADDISPVPRRDLAVTDLTAAVGEGASHPPPVPLGPNAPRAPAVNFDASGGKTPKRRKSSATGSSGAAASSGRKNAAPTRTRSVGAEIRSIFGLDDQEANQQKQALSKISANDTSKWGPYAVKNHTVRHPILGNMTIPAITSDPVTSSEKAANNGVGGTTGIEFRKSLGINEAEVSFPSTDAATRSEKRKNNSSTKSWHRLGDGLRVPLSALSFPTTDPVETEVGVATEQDGAQVGADSVGNHTEKQSTAIPVDTGTNDSTFSGIGSIQIISVRGATIRELHNLDEAEVSLGRLGQHERRSYVEKNWLPEPPPEDDEEEDEECVGVMRYKIILTDEDRQKLALNCLSHYKYGWISDRGRLVSDPYMICKEL